MHNPLRPVRATSNAYEKNNEKYQILEDNFKRVFKIFRKEVENNSIL